MTRVGEQLRRAIATLLLVETLQVVLTTIALTLVYRGQILPPYGFFPTQLYDFLAKLRWLGGDVLGWMPALPDSFLATSLAAHTAVLATLLPAGIAMAVLVAAATAVIVTPLNWSRLGSARSYLVVWVVLGLAVHTVVAATALSLGDSPTLSHIIYRSRSLLIDGAVVSMAVFVASSLIAWMLLPAFARRPRAALTCSVLVVAVVALAMAGGGAAGSEAVVAGKMVSSHDSPSRPANVVLISLDSLRADHVGCYGYDRDTTPSLDRFADEGMRFANTVSTSSWTLPTHLTMFTSRYQLSHGVVHETYTLSADVPTAGEMFKAAGYATAGFVSAPYTAARYGYARGMDVYHDISAEYAERAEARSAIVAPKVNEQALPWIEANRDRPFFVFLHYFDIHYDYVPPPPYDTMFDPHYSGDMDGRDFIERHDVHAGMESRDLEHILALYDGEIRFTDDHVGAVLRQLDELGLRDKTLVIIVSDHGDEFFEHHNKGHHRTLYDEVLRVPLLIRLPDGSRAGSVVDYQASLVDILPTMLDVAGIEPPRGLEGVSLLDQGEGGALARREATYAAFFDKRGFNLQVARRTPSYNVIQHFNRITHPKRRPLEFYDLATDPHEEHDLGLESRAEMYQGLDAMSQFLESQWRTNRRRQQTVAGGNRIEIDDDTMERLKSLGYVGD